MPNWTWETDSEVVGCWSLGSGFYKRV